MGSVTHFQKGIHPMLKRQIKGQTPAQRREQIQFRRKMVCHENREAGGLSFDRGEAKAFGMAGEDECVGGG